MPAKEVIDTEYASLHAVADRYGVKAATLKRLVARFLSGSTESGAFEGQPVRVARKRHRLRLQATGKRRRRKAGRGLATAG